MSWTDIEKSRKIVRFTIKKLIMLDSLLRLKCGLFMLSFLLIRNFLSGNIIHDFIAAIQRWLFTLLTYQECGAYQLMALWRIWIHLLCFSSRGQIDHLCWDIGLLISATHILKTVSMYPDYDFDYVSWLWDFELNTPLSLIIGIHLGLSGHLVH